MTSYLLTGGVLYNGLGTPPYQADILIRDGKILQIEPAGSVHFPGCEIHEIEGFSVSPGWIDVHAHSDASVLAAPEMFGKISQGVTTEISGNCGLSAFPVTTAEVREHLRELYAVYDIIPDWSGFASYADRINARQPAVNTLFLCGHNTLRANVSGYQRKMLTASDVEAMNRLLAEMLHQGAAGLSTGLLYVPGCFSEETELLSLLKTTASQNGIYATHLRNEGDRLEEALLEAVGLAEKAGVTLQLSHLKTALPRNWHKLDSILKIIENARKKGFSIYADRYPYTSSLTSLSIVLGPPYDIMTDADIRYRLQNNAGEYEQARQQLAASTRNWKQVVLSRSNAPAAAGLNGLTIEEAALRRGKTPSDLVLEILREDAPGSLAAFQGMSEQNLNRILLQDWVCCGTDETARPADRTLGFSHPRGFGSFPQYIRRCRSLGMPMEQIIRKITALPARIFHLHSRGVIQPGMNADLVVFDEMKLNSQADFSHPHLPADGIRQVFVNGTPSYDGENRKVTARAGKVIRHRSGSITG